MVEIIQRYDLSATAGAASLILSADNVGLPVHRGAKPNPLAPAHFSAKNNSSPKARNDENRLAFQPDFQAHGTRSGGRCDCGYRDSDRDGKRR